MTSLKIAYLSGPVDAADVYRAWSKRKQEDFFGTVYLNQFFDICAELDAEAYVVTTLPGFYTHERIGNVIFENRPLPSLHGVYYHLAMLVWFCRLIPHLLRFNPHVLILTAVANYWFLLAFMRWTRTIIVPSFHCSLWPKFGTLRLSWRLCISLNRALLLRHVKAAIAVSDDAAEQLKDLVKGDIDVSVFNATYPRAQFSSIRSAAWNDKPPFKIYFAGRIEINKGVYDLLQIAARLNGERPGEFHFDLCGEGSELERLKDKAQTLGVADMFVCHGWCNSATVSQLLGESHCVIIPTTTDFEEGFPKVFAEAILSCRPVITSSVCITKRLVQPAALEVPPNDARAYHSAVQRLCDDHKLYEQKRDACYQLQEMFYNVETSWGSRLRYVLRRYCIREG